MWSVLLESTAAWHAPGQGRAAVHAQIVVAAVHAQVVAVGMSMSRHQTLLAKRKRSRTATLGTHLVRAAHVCAAVHAQVVAVGGLGAALAGAAEVGDAGSAAVAQVAEVLRVLPPRLHVPQLAGACRRLANGNTNDFTVQASLMSQPGTCPCDQQALWIVMGTCPCVQQVLWIVMG